MKKYCHYAWVICLGCFFICALTSPIINATATQYLKPVTQEFGVSRSAFTLSSTIVALVGMIVSPLWGKIYSNKARMRNVLTLTTLCFGLSYMGYSLAKSIIQFYIFAAILGFFWAGACFMPVSMMITAWFNKMRGLAMSITLAGIGLGGGILAPLIRSLIVDYGWRSTYQIVGTAIIVIVCPVVYLLMKPTPEYMGLKPFGDDLEIEESKKEKVQYSDEGTIEIDPADARHHAFFWIFMLGFFGMGLVCSAPMRQMYPYVSDLYGSKFAAGVLAMGSFLGVFAKIILGLIHDKFGNLKASAFAFLAFTAAFIIAILGATVGKDLFYVYIVFYSLAAGVGTVSAPLLIGATFGTKNFNMMRGITQSPLQAGMSLGGILVASAFDITGKYTLGWAAVAVISVASMICFFVAHKMSRKVYQNR